MLSKFARPPLKLSRLDELIVRLVIFDARRLMARDLTVREAAEQACRGTWYPLRHEVARRLSAERRCCASSVRPGSDAVVPRSGHPLAALSSPIGTAL